MVLDYRGAPYLRISARRRGGEPQLRDVLPEPDPVRPDAAGESHGAHPAELASASAAATRTSGTTAGCTRWRASRSRLACLSSGRWNVPVRVDGRLAAINGGLWHADHPSLVWFWPIVVLLACVLAARRLRRRDLDFLRRPDAGDRRADRGHDRRSRGAAPRPAGGSRSSSSSSWPSSSPSSPGDVWRAVLHRPGYFTAFLVAVGAISAGGVLIPTLLHGFVLIALPGVPGANRDGRLPRHAARGCCCSCSGCSTMPIAMRSVRTAGAASVSTVVTSRAWRRRACRGRLVGLAAAVLALRLRRVRIDRPVGAGAAPPAKLLAEARPIGRGPAFQPPATGPVLGRCDRATGPSRRRPRRGVRGQPRGPDSGRDRNDTAPRVRLGADLERRLLRGARNARAHRAGPGAARRAARARPICSGPGGSRCRRAALPPSRRRRADRVRVFVDGRRWSRSPGRVPLRAHSEIVLEVGPYVPPHSSYAFPPGT